MLQCIIRKMKTPPGSHPKGVCGRPELSVAGLLDGLARDVRNVRAADAEVAEFAVAHAAEFRNGLTILAPIVERACNVHVPTPFPGVPAGSRLSAPALF